jgi:hypothetical protein
MFVRFWTVNRPNRLILGAMSPVLSTISTVQQRTQVSIAGQRSVGMNVALGYLSHCAEANGRIFSSIRVLFKTGHRAPLVDNDHEPLRASLSISKRVRPQEDWRSDAGRLVAPLGSSPNARALLLRSSRVLWSLPLSIWKWLASNGLRGAIHLWCEMNLGPSVPVGSNQIELSTNDGEVRHWTVSGIFNSLPKLTDQHLRLADWPLMCLSNL